MTKEERKAYNKAYNEANRERHKSWASEYYMKNNKQIKEKRRKKYEENPEKTMLRAAKRRAVRDGVEFSIKESDIKIPEVCPVLGFKLEVSKTIHSYNSPTVDRIDSGKGYVPANIKVISHRANAIKRDGTADEHELIAKYIRENLLTVAA